MPVISKFIVDIKYRTFLTVGYIQAVALGTTASDIGHIKVGRGGWMRVVKKALTTLALLPHASLNIPTHKSATNFRK